MNAIYRYEWQGRSGHSYRLDLIPPDTTALSAPEIRTLPPGAVEPKQLTCRYDKYPLGIGEVPELTVEVSLDLLPDDEIRTILTDQPYVIGTQFFVWTIPVIIGIGLALWVNAGSGWVLIFAGNAIDDVEYDIGERRVTLRAQHVIRRALAFLRFGEYDDSTLPIYPQPAVRLIQQRYNLGGGTYTYESLYGAFYMSKLSDLHSLINTALAIIASLMMRNYQSLIYTIVWRYPIMLKQTTAAAGTPGAELLPSEIYFIKRGVVSGVTIGALVEKDEYSLINRYASIWDYVREYAEWAMLRPIWTGATLELQPIYYAGFIASVATSDLLGGKRRVRPQQLRQVQVSSPEKYTMNEFEEIDRWEEVKQSVRSDNSYNVTNVWSNVPLGVYYDRRDSSRWIARRVRTSGLYYYDANEFYRCHEYVRWLISQQLNLDSEDYIAPAYMDWSELPPERPTEKCLKCQSISTYGRWAAKLLVALFGSDHQRTIDVELPYNQPIIDHAQLIMGRALQIDSIMHVPLSIEIDFAAEQVRGTYYAVQ